MTAVRVSSTGLLTLWDTPTIRVLTGEDRERAKAIIRAEHYTRSVPSGKSHYVAVEAALVVWAIPANKNAAHFILGYPGVVWELARLWAPDGHDPNLLSRAISEAVRVIVRLEHPDAVLSYADPSAGHRGGVYRAASWLHHGTSAEGRAYRDTSGQVIARRAFHSGKTHDSLADIQARGYEQVHLPGKERFVRPLSRRAKRALVLGAAT